MKILFCLFSLGLVTAVSAASSAYTVCTPPSLYFLQEKIRDSYKLSQGERELKDIVKAPKNFELREEVKSVKQSLVFAKRRDEQFLLARLKTSFGQMAANVETEDVIADYPVKGASSVVTANEAGKLQIEMENLSQEELDFLPPDTLSKLDRKVSIHYNYPFDSFDYYLTFDGRQLPMEKAMFKMLDEFEDMCARKRVENKKDSEVTGAGATRSQ